MSETRLVYLVGMIVLIAVAGRASAWNIPGHMLSAAIAHQLFTQDNLATIDKVKAALAVHPWHSTHWQSILAPFSGTDKDLMLFMLAAR